MLALQINRHRRSNMTPKQALRAHFDRMSPEKRREFIDSALQLIAERILLDEVADEVDAIQSLQGQRYNATN
jgi:hypothetical protein